MSIGGHTTEMLRVAQAFTVLGAEGKTLQPMVFVAASTDRMSEMKLRQVPSLKQVRTKNGSVWPTQCIITIRDRF